MSNRVQCLNAADPVDKHIGRRIRARREELGLPRQALVPTLGVSWQQAEKYETGMNRVSGSMLHRFAKALSVPPGYFFEGLPDVVDAEAPLDRMLREFGQTSYGRALMIAAMELPVDVVTQATALLLTMARPVDNVKPLRRAAR